MLQLAGEKARAVTDQLQLKEELLFDKGILVRGRQVLWMINENFRTSSTTDSYYDILDLAELQYPGDAKMTTFLYLWDICINSMDPRLSDETLRDALVRKLRRSPAMKDDLAAHNRIDATDPNKTYQRVRGRVDAYLLRQQQEKNQEEKSNLFKREVAMRLSPRPPVAMPRGVLGRSVGMSPRTVSARHATSTRKANEIEGILVNLSTSLSVRRSLPICQSLAAPRPHLVGRGAAVGEAKGGINPRPREANPLCGSCGVLRS